MGKSWSNLKDYDFDGTKLTMQPEIYISEKLSENDC